MSRQKKGIAKRLVGWWRKQDRRYGWWWRAGNAAAALLIITSILIPVAQEAWQHDKYQLSSQALELVGKTDESLAKQLTYDGPTATYQFNKAEITTGADTGLPAAVQKASAGATDKANTKSYALEVPTDMTKGVTYHDTNSQLSFSMVPQFKGLPGKTQQGHIVFPLTGDNGGNQAVYTLKNNGLKEDIIVPEVTEDVMSFGYNLKLPDSLEARVIPDGDGAIGIYSADPALFGDISFGSDADRKKVEDARRDGTKSTLVFGLPAPVVKDAKGNDVGNARFELKGTSLSVVAEDIKEAQAPITIDPSVVVTSTSDLQTGGNNEGMIDFGTSGQVTRGGLTGGTMGTWATTSDNYTSQCGGVASAAYNGYLYSTGCNNGSTAVRYAVINSNGTLGNWQSNGVDMNTERGYHRLEAYNGYLYAIGGNMTSGLTNSVEYGLIGSNGSISAWYAASSFTTARVAFASAVYNGYLYIMGGYDGSNPKNDVQYAAVKADGSLGSWASTTSFTTTRANLGGFAYNGYLYIMGGYNAASTYYSDVQYAPISSSGTVGTWVATTSFTTARTAPEVTVYNGYAYIMGGTSNVTSALTDTQYAQINANGTLGTWRTSSTLNTGVWAASTAAYNGYLYIVAGRNATSTSLATTQYAKIDIAGQPTAFATLSNNFTTARALGCGVAYNGYLYHIGGSTTDNILNNVTTVQYTALNSTGGNGSWSSTTVLPAARGSSGCVAYNGYLYVVGGIVSGSGVNTTLYTTISSNGTLGASWTTSPNNLSAVRGLRPGVFVYAGTSATYLYAIGGGCDGAISSNCQVNEYATLNTSTGAVGTWTTLSAMSQQWGFRGYAIAGKYLYAFGGYKNTGGNAVTTDVEYVVINANGTLGTWQSTGSLNTAIGFTNGTTVNGCIYAVGGEVAAGTSLANVQYACPNANGTITAWNNAPNLSVATTDMGVTSYAGYLYGVGGYTTSVQTTTQSAYVNNGGSGVNGAWALSANGLAADRKYNASTAYNGYIYTAGGVTGSTPSNDVQYGQIGATGSLGTFTIDAHTFTNGRESNAVVAYNGYLYVLGGNSGATIYGDTQYAPIGSGGGLSANFASSTSFVTGTGSDTGRTGICSVAYNGYVYALGGADTSARHADTRYAAINSNGTLGTWADSGNNFTTARAYHNCFAANGYMYVLGGGTGSANLNDVQAAPINSNGTLGAWVTTTPFTGVRETAIAGYSNGFAYIYGGCSNTACNAYLGDTQFAPVNANGTLGAWQRTAATFDGVSSSVGEGSGVVYNNYLYTVGGQTIANTNINYAPLNSISRQGRYSKLMDLGVPTNITGITYNGSVPTSARSPGLSPILYKVAGTDGVFGASNQYSSNIIPGTFSCQAGNPNYARYVLVTFLLNDATGAGIFPDAAGTISNLTDFTVTYTPVHPDANIRLRHGQTLQAGNLSALDTCS